MSKPQGQSVADRIIAARHSIAGQGLAKSVCKATTEELMGPKKKHIDYLLQCTNEPNVSIPQLADLLIERTQHTNWIVTFKSLVTIHNLMNYGNERFTQYLASNNCSFNLSNFLDKTGVQGYDMSTYVRRYTRYLNEKSVSYRSMAFDFCKVKRGKDDGMLRKMNPDKLLKALPVLQCLIDTLLEFDVSTNELTNGVINACFMLLFKDLIRLFACYNDGIINLLEKYFDMNKKQCKEALDIYKKFIVRMDKVGEFLKVAESVGIDKGDIPDLAKAPSSLLEALEAHLQSLESNKKSGTSTASMKKPASVTSAINALNTTNNANLANITEAEKRQILEEENRQLQQLKENKEKSAIVTDNSSLSTNPFASSIKTTTDSTAVISLPSSTQASSFNDPFGLTSPTQTSAIQSSSEPATINPFSPTNPTPSGEPVDLFQTLPASGTSPWETVPQQTANHSNGFLTNGQLVSSFASVSPASTVSWGSAPPAGYDGFGEVMKPTSQTNQSTLNSQLSENQTSLKSGQKIIQGNLDVSLANLAGSLNINGPAHQTTRLDHQWTSQTEKKLTGGANWAIPPQNPASSTFNTGTVPGAMPGMMPATFPGAMTNTSGMGVIGQPVNLLNQSPSLIGQTPTVNQQQPMMMPTFQQHGQMTSSMGIQGHQAFNQSKPQSNSSDPFGAL